MKQQKDLFQHELRSRFNRRRELLPWWVKVFTWMFLVLGAVVPFALIFGMLGYRFQLSLYGLETNEPSSITGLFLMIVFLINGTAAYGLLAEKNWAVKFSIVDAVLGLAICVFVMLYPLIVPQPKHVFSFRLELLLLIPYLLLLIKIKDAWKTSVDLTAK